MWEEWKEKKVINKQKNKDWKKIFLTNLSAPASCSLLWIFYEEEDVEEDKKEQHTHRYILKHNLMNTNFMNYYEWAIFKGYMFSFHTLKLSLTLDI